MSKCNTAMFTLVVLLLTPVIGIAQDKRDGDDDTLRHYLSKSDAVVVGKVTAGTQRLGIEFGSSVPVQQIEFQFRVSESIKGKLREKQKISVLESRAIDLGLTAPQPGQKLVLFLKSSGGALESADKWYGVRPYSRAFVEQLKRVQSEAAPATESE